MAEVTKVAETSRRGLEPVNPKLAGQYDQIVALLARRLGADHAFLFAEPAALGGAAAGAADTAWYCKGTGTARPISALAPAEASAVQAKLAALVHDIETLAEQMQSEGEVSRELGRLLKDALVVPDADRVWVVDGRPVLVDWGSRLQTGGFVSAGRSGLLTAMGGAGTPSRRAAQAGPLTQNDAMAEAGAGDGPAGAPPAQGPPPARAPRRGRWLAHAALWIVFAALTLASAVRLLEACALGPLWPAFVRDLLPAECVRAAVNPQTVAADERARSLDAQVRRQEIALGAKAARCALDCRTPEQVKPEQPKPNPIVLPPPPLPRPDPIVPPPLPKPTPIPVVGPTVDEVNKRASAFERGRLEVTLAWDGAADLDLHVVCPNRKEIYFRDTSNCGGRFVSKDLCVGGCTADAHQVEHVIWTGEPDPEGTYTVRAQLYKRYAEKRPAVPYTVVLRLDGKVIKEHSGQLSNDGQTDTAFTFNSPLRQ